LADGIIGYTGFVGEHLSSQRKFAGHFNSKNICDMAQSKFDTIVCAAAPGSMFEANKYPERDWDKWAVGTCFNEQ